MAGFMEFVILLLSTVLLLTDVKGKKFIGFHFIDNTAYRCVKIYITLTRRRQIVILSSFV